MWRDLYHWGERISIVIVIYLWKYYLKYYLKGRFAKPQSQNYSIYFWKYLKMVTGSLVSVGPSVLGNTISGNTVVGNMVLGNSVLGSTVAPRQRRGTPSERFDD